MKNDVNGAASLRSGYAAPKLTVFGSALKLTASGTGVNNENPGATNQFSRQRP